MKKATVMEVLLAKNGDVVNWQQSNNEQTHAAIEFLVDHGHIVHQVITPYGCNLRLYPVDGHIDLNINELYTAMKSTERDI